MTSLSDSPLATLVRRVASTDPTPGAGPTSAWTCALAAALVEMVSAIDLAGEPVDAHVTGRRHDRAAALRAAALALADEDAAAYAGVLAVRRRRSEPGHAGRLQDALSRAADPPMRIVEVAAELTGLAADAAVQARGAIRGEAITAATLAEAVTRAALALVELNLAGAHEDPRRARARELSARARCDLDRTEGE